MGNRVECYPKISKMVFHRDIQIFWQDSSIFWIVYLNICHTGQRNTSKLFYLTVSFPAYYLLFLRFYNITINPPSPCLPLKFSTVKMSDPNPSASDEPQHLLTNEPPHLKTNIICNISQQSWKGVSHKNLCTKRGSKEYNMLSMELNLLVVFYRIPQVIFAPRFCVYFSPKLLFCVKCFIRYSMKMTLLCR